MSDAPDWRQARIDDLQAMIEIAAAVHPGHPERPAIFAERLALYPRGVLVFANGAPAGYAISHPWMLNRSPTLDMLLGELPSRPDTFYVHDIALMPEMRGKRAGRKYSCRTDPDTWPMPVAN